MDRVKPTRRKLRALEGLVEERLRAHYGDDYMEQVRARRAAEGQSLSASSGIHDSRFILTCIAFDEALHGDFPSDERESARVLVSISNAAEHEDTKKFRRGDADRAEQIVERLLSVAGVSARRSAPSYPRSTVTPVGPPKPPPPPRDVSSAIGQAQRAAETERQTAERVARQTQERERTDIERRYRLQHTVDRFLELMRAAGNPGALPIEKQIARRKTFGKGHTYERGRVTGWRLATKGASSPTRQVEGCFLDTDGQLWRELVLADGGLGVIVEQMDLDAAAVRARPGMSVLDGWDNGYHLSPLQTPAALDHRIIQSIGELCFKHGINWQEPDWSVLETEVEAAHEQLPHRRQETQQEEQAAAARQEQLKQVRQVAPWFLAPALGVLLGLLLAGGQLATVLGFAGLGAVWRPWYITSRVSRGKKGPAGYRVGIYEVVTGALMGAALGGLLALTS
jgi:hypothetical protein